MAEGKDARDVELQPILANAAPAGADSWRPLWLHNSIYRAAVKNLLLICTWYFFSTCLSLFNKRLLGREHDFQGRGPFPAPLLMTSVQFVLQHFMAKAVLRLGIVKRRATEVLSWEQYARQVATNGVCTGLDIGLSNFSLALITLSFYTMCKSSTPLFLLCFAFMWRIERPSWGLAGVVGTISVGLLLLVFGEAQFNFVGFLLVMSASCLSGLRWTITQVLLQGSAASEHGGAGGPVEVLHQLTPVMAVTVGVMSLCVEKLWVTLPASPYFDTPDGCLRTMGVFIFGALIGFLMVWAEFKVIAETSALTFMIAGTFKEIVTVMAAVMFLGEQFLAINGVGLLVLICGVLMFNYYKYSKITAGEQEFGRRPLGSEEEVKRSEAGALAAQRSPQASPTQAMLTMPKQRRDAFSSDGGGTSS